MENNKKALVVFSGGQDSTTCLFWAKTKFESVEAISFDYGQKHRLELQVAESIAEKANVPFHLFKLDLLNRITRNALTDPNMMVENEKPENRPPNTLVEGRNMLFLTYAAIFAKSKEIRHLVTGVGQADYSGYPDCRDEFVRSLNQTLNLSMDFDYEIHTPLMWKNKAQIWQLADELGIFDLVRNETLTCYNGIIGDGCGNCPACKLRRKGLESLPLTPSKGGGTRKEAPSNSPAVSGGEEVKKKPTRAQRIEMSEMNKKYRRASLPPSSGGAGGGS